MTKHILRKKIFRLVITLLVVTTVLSFFATRNVIKADELSDLSAQIQQKQKEKDQTLQKIKDIEKNIQNIINAKGSLSSQKTQLAGQKADLEKQIVDLETQIVSQESFLADYAQKLDNKKLEIQEKTNYMYKLSYLKPDMIFGTEKNAKEYFNDLARTNASIELFRAEVKDYQDKIATISVAKSQIESDKKTITESRNAVDSQIAQVNTQLAAQEKAQQNAIAAKGQQEAQLNSITSQLQGMSAKQKALLDAEIAKMNAAAQANQVVLESGQYYFMGRGRDMIEGHGLGMSQWGAYGMAAKGWSYDKILTFYYTGTAITTWQEPTEIVVDGKTGVIPFDDYLAGIGEVPNSWPAEAVKAQVVAARTYAMRAAKLGSDGKYHICGTDSCQVYVGGLGKKDYVAQTKGKVITHGGQPIVAYYSASHRGHSSSINSAWGAADLPYIKPVNDNEFAYKDYSSANPYYKAGCNCPQYIKTYNWNWRTNGYSLDDLTLIFSKSPSLNVGKVKRIEIIKDVSNRVSRITLVGESATKTLTGWDFKAIFNAATPFNDYVYSTEFGFYQK